MKNPATRPGFAFCYLCQTLMRRLVPCDDGSRSPGVELVAEADLDPVLVKGAVEESASRAEKRGIEGGGKRLNFRTW